MRCGDFKETYLQDEAIFQSVPVKCSLALFFVFLVIFPFVANAYLLYMANMIGFAVIGAVGLNLLTGFTGQISLGHSAFMGVGAYTSAILITRYGLSFWLSLPIAGLVSALAGMIIGLPSFRVKGLYLCIATLASQFIFEFIFVHWESMTNGITGILCHGGGICLQAIEGGRNEVNRLYAMILQDKRHKDVVLLHYEEITERRFSGWSMGKVNLAKLNTSVVLKYSERPVLDPYRVSGKVSLALLEELMLTASIVGRT